VCQTLLSLDLNFKIPTKKTAKWRQNFKIPTKKNSLSLNQKKDRDTGRGGCPVQKHTQTF